MRDGEDLATCLFFVGFQIIPQVFRIGAIKGAERNYLAGFFGSVTKNHNPVKIVPIRERAVFIANNCSEFTRVIMGFGSIYNVVPDGLGKIWTLNSWRIRCHVNDKLAEYLAPFILVHQFAPLGTGLGSAQTLIAICDGRHDAEIFCVISHHQEIKRARNANGHAVMTLDLFAFGKSISPIRTDFSIAVAIGVKRDIGVQVSVPKVDILREIPANIRRIWLVRRCSNVGHRQQ